MLIRIKPRKTSANHPFTDFVPAGTRNQIMMEAIRYQSKQNALFVRMLAYLHSKIENEFPEKAEEILSAPECEQIYKESDEIINGTWIEILDNGEETITIQEKKK